MAWLKQVKFFSVWVRMLIAFAFGAFALLVALIVYDAAVPGGGAEMTNDEAGTQTQFSSTDEQSVATAPDVYQTILPSLVAVSAGPNRRETGDLFDLGSGVLINGEAHVLTALHLVEDASEIEVHFSDGTQSEATIAFRRPGLDLAILEPADLPTIFLPATIDVSQRTRIGDPIFAVGNPLGLGGSMSAGIISGFERVFSPRLGFAPVEGLIQFDSAVNSGSPGGPLLNQFGQVIGIVIGLANPTNQEVFIGIGFAVPMEVAGRAVGIPTQ